MDDKNRQKAIELAIASIEKEYGKGAIMRLKDGESLHDEIAVVPTGSIGLDIALGIGGYPARPHHRDLRPGVERQDHAHPPRHRQRPEGGRRRRVHRRRARARSDLRQASSA